jgi:hypothetical protein
MYHRTMRINIKLIIMTKQIESLKNNNFIFILFFGRENCGGVKLFMEIKLIFLYIIVELIRG